MQGNAREWCFDQYAKGYPTDQAVVNPHGPDAGDRRVVRGGSYMSRPQVLGYGFLQGAMPRFPKRVTYLSLLHTIGFRPVIAQPITPRDGVTHTRNPKKLKRDKE